ncbi:MAG: Ig-like domain-containing protein [Kofleriaceae bacterium]
MAKLSFRCGLLALCAAGCGSTTEPLATADPGVVFTFPADHQVDVPLGTRIVVTFSDPVVESALGSVAISGPNGAVDATAEITGDGKSVQFAAAALEAGTTYEISVGPALVPDAKNIPDGPLFSFTTRASRPRSAAPALVAVNGAPPETPEAFRPMLETSTIRLVFSEPLDPRTVTLAPGSIELVDVATRAAVPATLVAQDVHVSIDPIDDLMPGTAYEVRVGSNLADLGGGRVAASTVTLTPHDSGASSPIAQTLRTRQDGDPGPKESRSGADRNVVVIDKPLIGRELSTVLPAALHAELGDPKALDEVGNAIAFTIRRGQRISLSGLDIKLGGQIPAGLQTGDIQIEFLTDAGGRLYRNPHQPENQRPENLRSPLYVDLSMDVAVYTTDATGNAVIAQTVMGVQATGTALATDGVLAIEAVTSMELGLLGVTQAPSNLVLELITDPAANVPADTTPPELVTSEPLVGTDHAPGDGIELVFSEPVDLDRLRAGGLRLETAAGVQVQSVIESHGSAIVVRPVQRMPYSTSFRLQLTDIADVAGNAMTAPVPLTFATPALQNTDVPLTVTAVHPGVPCTLTGGSATMAGRCSGGEGSDDLYRPFELAANEPIEATYSQPLNPNSAVLGGACNAGSVRVETVDANGACSGVVPGTLIKRDRGIAFIPDVPWTTGARYRLSLVSGGDEDCDANELCGLLSGDAASFDPLSGTDGGDGGGPNLVIDFVGAAASKAVFLFAEASPFSDKNGNGFLDGAELTRDENRAAMRITGTTGDVGSASFDMDDCVPETPEVEGCMYIDGAMPVQLGELEMNCPLPDGSTAAACMPVGLAPQAMFGTSLTMKASVGISITTDTGTNVLRIREPADGPVKGYIIDDGGAPTMVVALEMYMDAPDMSIPLSDHDLHSKQMSISLRGPVTFLPDGRISIALSNVADVPVAVNIDAPLGLGGAVEMALPAGQMKLQLLSRPLRGVEP